MKTISLWLFFLKQSKGIITSPFFARMSAVRSACMLTETRIYPSERYKNTRPEHEHTVTKPQAEMYKPYGFYSLLSANHGYTAVKILTNLYGLTTTFGMNSVRTIGSQ